MQDNQEKCKELAIRIYNLDEEVYKCVGSSPVSYTHLDVYKRQIWYNIDRHNHVMRTKKGAITERNVSHGK